MATLFPTNPTLNQSFTIGSATYNWNGYAWVRPAISAGIISAVITATQQLYVSSSTNSTSTTTGAVVVVGGVGIGRDLNVGGIITQQGSVVLTTSSLSAQVISGTDISVLTNNSTGALTINDTSTLQTVTLRGAITNQAVSITNTTNSVSSSTGALTIKGGVGIEKDLQVYGNITAQGNIIANGNIVLGDSTTTDTITIGAEIQSNVIPTVSNIYNLGSQTNYWRTIYASNEILFATTNSTSSTTGALQVRGGVGISNDVYVGGVIKQQGNSILTTASLASFVLPGVDISITANTSTGVITINNTATLQSLTSRGAITTEALYIANTTTSVSTITGALVVTGGVGIGGRLNAESVKIADTVFDSTLVSINTTETVVVDSYSMLEFRAAKYLIQIDDDTGPGAKFQVIEILLLVDNVGTVYATEYGVLTTSGELGSFAADVQSNIVRLYFTPYVASNKVISVMRTGMAT
jgi:hypothetical protein